VSNLHIHQCAWVIEAYEGSHMPLVKTIFPLISENIISISNKVSERKHFSHSTSVHFSKIAYNISEKEVTFQQVGEAIYPPIFAN
jgi:hypothetical protein